MLQCLILAWPLGESSGHHNEPLRCWTHWSCSLIKFFLCTKTSWELTILSERVIFVCGYFFCHVCVMFLTGIFLLICALHITHWLFPDIYRLLVVNSNCYIVFFVSHPVDSLSVTGPCSCGNWLWWHDTKGFFLGIARIISLVDSLSRYRLLMP